MQNKEKNHFSVHILVYMDFFLYLCALICKFILLW